MIAFITQKSRLLFPRTSHHPSPLPFVFLTSVARHWRISKCAIYIKSHELSPPTFLFLPFLPPRESRRVNPLCIRYPKSRARPENVFWMLGLNKERTAFFNFRQEYARLFLKNKFGRVTPISNRRRSERSQIYIIA